PTPAALVFRMTAIAAPPTCCWMGHSNDPTRGVSPREGAEGSFLLRFASCRLDCKEPPRQLAPNAIAIGKIYRKFWAADGQSFPQSDYGRVADQPPTKRYSGSACNNLCCFPMGRIDWRRPPTVAPVPVTEARLQRTEAIDPYRVPSALIMPLESSMLTERLRWSVHISSEIIFGGSSSTYAPAASSDLSGKIRSAIATRPSLPNNSTDDRSRRTCIRIKPSRLGERAGASCLLANSDPESALLDRVRSM